MTLALSGFAAGHGGRPVVEGVSAALAPGSIAALVGPNGAGKSTLLRGLAGLLPSSGAVTLDGRPAGAAERRARIAYMPQDLACGSGLTLLEVVLLGRLATLGLRVPAATVAAARAALAGLGLAGLEDRAVSEVSGGQRQLAFLAQALFREPRVLLLDEPTAALDLRHQLLVLGALRERVRADGTMAVVTMHDLGQAAQLADTMLCLAGGRLEAAGTPAEVLTPARLARVWGIEALVGPGPAGGLQVVPLAACAGWPGGAR